MHMKLGFVYESTYNAFVFVKNKDFFRLHILQVGGELFVFMIKAITAMSARAASKGHE